MTQSNANDDQTKTHVVLNQGTVVHHYRIVEKIGAGGMGEVYLADDTKLQRRVALKFLPSHLANDGAVRTRFTREAQAAAKLDHPNIVTIYEVGEFQGRPFFAMQYVEGQTLHHYCHERPISFESAIDLLQGVAEGLARAHGAGVTHRDIKSANIIVDSDMRPKILDFGLATVQGGEMLTKTGSTLGTVTYMSPEQSQGHEVDHRSDLFSLGIVFYELIAGTTPFRRNNDAATVHAIINEEPDPLSRYKANTPDELQRIVSKCLAKDPGMRYQSAADLAADLRAIRQSFTSGVSRSSIQAAKRQPSIAVLPFSNMSADPENEYFSDGLTEELLNVLAKNPELKVTGRTSSFAFKGKQEDLRGIGQKLGVATLLEGSVRKAGNRVRITAQLVNTSDGFHLWSDTYDRVLDDIFAVQDDIAKAVSEALHVTLLGQPEKQRVVDPKSYALVLRAHQLELQMSKSSMAMAHDLYKKATEIDSENARAWAGLAATRLKQAAYGFDNTVDGYRDGKVYALKAIELDESVPEAHEALGWLLAAFEFNFKKAGECFKKALELAPNNSRQILSMSIYYLIQGKFKESCDLSAQAIGLDPLDPDAHLQHGRNLLYARRYKESRQSLEHALKLSPGLTTANLLLSWAYLHENMLEESLAAAKQEELTGYRNCGLAIVYDAMGRREESDRALAELIAEGKDVGWGFQIADVYGARGDNDKAFEWLEHSLMSHDAGIPLTRVSMHFDKIHSDPRWPEFLKKIGLAD